MVSFGIRGRMLPGCSQWSRWLSQHTPETFRLFSLDGIRVVSGSNDETLRLWVPILIHSLDICTLPSQSHCLTLPQSSLQPNSLVAFMEGEWIFSAEKRRLCWIPVSCHLMPYCLSFSGTLFALGSRDGQVDILDFTYRFLFKFLLLIIRNVH